MDFKQQTDTIIQTIIAPSAVETDRNALYPRAAIKALGEAGLLGLTSAKEVGGMGLGLTEAATVVEMIANVCSSTAMIVTMHYAANAVLEQFASEAVRRDVAAGKHLSTLAWSESGSRSHFWAPVGTAEAVADGYKLTCSKTMVTSAGEADSYVWSSRPSQGDGASSLWLVDSKADGLTITNAFDGMGLRGNASAPMRSAVTVSKDALLGTDGGGFDIMIGVVLPVFSVLNASCSIGLMEGALAAACQHVGGNKLQHLDSSLADLPTVRAYLARARIQIDQARTLRDDTLSAVATGRADAMLRVMEVKASASEAALTVTDIAMRVCGGAAFRKDLGIERQFRDARASAIMAPTSDVLYDFIGKAICGLPVF
ncbi:acyl-CoA dehydrogenase family protein [Thiothrix lacustris]|uniref:acyl-CoA dehydrogenase family protein n=1 Tax=Thiothrix lacustris TaxID=525917 RepID=UPI0027E58C75|nr:acyl-CoA dehydrogenase family protein [Thiothrix lacustris]WMP19016.1 acyl-CoA dehydrogenase family protein [Thiothrix lacustris]